MAKVKLKEKKKPVKKTASKKTVAKKAADKSLTTSKKTSPKKLPVKKEPVKKKAAKKTKKRKPETLMCFLTTACVDYYGLPDQGYELTTLRNFRDTYLASTLGGKELIREYYTVSPQIVKLVNKDKEKRSIYTYIYSEVKNACAKIEAQHLLSAKRIYTTMVKTLMKRYSLS